MKSKKTCSDYLKPTRAAFALLVVCAGVLPFSGCVAPESTPAYKEAQARAEAEKAKQVAHVMEMRRIGTLSDAQAVDVLAAIIMAIFWSSIASQVNDIWTLAVPVIGVLVLKAGLTVLVARKLPPPPAA